MPWARVDDGFHDHPKVGGLSLAAVGLWTLCFTWANRHLGRNDLPPGFVPAHQPKKFGGTTKHIRELVDAGLWETTDGGWLFHDFVDYLPPSKDPQTASELALTRSEAGRKGAAARWANHGKPDSNLPSEPMANAWQPDDTGMRPVDAIAMPPTRTRTQEGGRAPSAHDTAPSPTCERHPHGTDEPCGPCAIARRAAQAWQKPTPTPPTVAELRAQGVIR